MMMTRAMCEYNVYRMPISYGRQAYWASAHETLVRFALAGGNPWIYAGDLRHLEKFETEEDYQAYTSLDYKDRDTLDNLVY